MLGKMILDLKIKYYEFITRNDVPVPKSEWALDWDTLVHLDVEELAEGGMKQAYDGLLPALTQFITSPAELTEIEVENSDDYIVELNGRRWVIMDEGAQSSGEVWVNAAVAFFEIVNSQLTNSDKTFYAFYGSHDFSGMFLTQEEYELGRSKLSNKLDWPYIPTHHGEFNGRPH